MACQKSIYQRFETGRKKSQLDPTDFFHHPRYLNSWTLPEQQPLFSYIYFNRGELSQLEDIINISPSDLDETNSHCCSSRASVYKREATTDKQYTISILRRVIDKFSSKIRSLWLHLKSKFLNFVFHHADYSAGQNHSSRLSPSQRNKTSKEISLDLCELLQNIQVYV